MNNQELEQELQEAETQWKQWEIEEEREPGKHALGFNALAEDISQIKQELNSQKDQNSNELDAL